MLEIIAAPVAEKVVEGLFTLIGRHLGYVWKYSNNISDLTQQIENLGDAIERLQQDVDEANRQGYEIFLNVQKWLSRADARIKEAEKLLEGEREANRGCFHLWPRYKQSKKANEQSKDIVNEIQEAVKYDKVGHLPPPPGIGSWSLNSYQVLESRETFLNEIMNALRDDGIRMIGIWGMGGVGKTTLVEQIAVRAEAAKQANEEKLFDIVVMALRISQPPVVKKIQGDIASMLGLKLEEIESEKDRAVSLSNSLKKHKKILVVLDDIWEQIKFETIGIPYEESDEHPMGHDCKVKVLLTSRKHDVLSKKMKTHKDFHLQHLLGEEAWSLFKQRAGDSVDEPDLRPIAREVVKECDGLPLAIVTIADTLKGAGVGIWRNALEELRRSEPTNIGDGEVSQKVYGALELSYKYLKSEEAKSFFLLCGLVSHGDISLDELLKYVVGLNLFGYMKSLEIASDKVVTLVTTLKDSSLLLDVVKTSSEPPSSYFMEEGSGYVRMHDVIRDVAKSIASKDPHLRFEMNEDVSLQEWEERGIELTNCTRMSLKYRDIQQLPEGLVCPKLDFFLLDSSDHSLKIPDTFFQGMKEVRVLSLSGVDLSQLPSSLHFLSNLRTLCLYQKSLSSPLSLIVLGELKKLQILSLVDFAVLDLPKEMMQLSDLRMLSMRDCIVFIPTNVISSLSRLEHLSVKDITCVSELKRLSCLRSLEMEIDYPVVLLDNEVSFNNLTRYDLFIGCRRDPVEDERNTSRRLKIEGMNVAHLVKCLAKPLKMVEVLELKRLYDIKHFVYELDCDGFLQLKYLSINWIDSMQYFMNTIEMESIDPPPTAFPLLEELNLRELHNLEAVCQGPIPMRCFANLRILRIWECDGLKCILWLPTSTAQGSRLVFPQLRRLELYCLPNLIDFCSTGISGSQEASIIIPFFSQQVAVPRLEFLNLVSVGNVRTIWHNQYLVDSCCTLKELKLESCQNIESVFPSTFVEGLKNLKSLIVDTCPSLKYLFPTSVVKGLLQLEVLTISDCGVVEEIVANDQNGGVEEAGAAAPSFSFPRLTSLKLSKLRQLKRFYDKEMYTLGCPLLKKLKVYKCDNLELLFQDKSLQYQVDKQPLFLVDEDTFPSMEKLELDLKESMEIWRGQFSRELVGKLRVLEIRKCRDILAGIPSSKLQVLDNLQKLTFQSCKVIQAEGLTNLSGFGLGLINLQKLHSLTVSKIGNLINIMSPSMAKRLVQLKRLSITDCSMMEAIVGNGGNDGDCFSNTSAFPSLEEMVVKKLPSLSNLFKKIPGLGQDLQKLRILTINDCRNLEILLTLSLAKTLVQLQKLTVEDCDKLKEIVEVDGGHEPTDDHDEIIFTKLQELELGDLPYLKSFCSARYTFRFPCLTKVWVTRCPKMEHFCKGESITPSLDTVVVNYRSSWVNDLNAIVQKMFTKTHSEAEDLQEWDSNEEDVEKEGDSDQAREDSV